MECWEKGCPYQIKDKLLSVVEKISMVSQERESKACENFPGSLIQYFWHFGIRLPVQPLAVN